MKKVVLTLSTAVTLSLGFNALQYGYLKESENAVDLKEDEIKEYKMANSELVEDLAEKHSALKNYSTLNEQLETKISKLEKEKAELVKMNKLKDGKIAELKKQ
jgi:predicted nuclease with TOPRIM domain